MENTQTKCQAMDVEYLKGISKEVVKRLRANLSIVEQAGQSLERAYEEEQLFISDVQNVCKFAADDLDVFFDNVCEVIGNLETALEVNGVKREFKR